MCVCASLPNLYASLDRFRRETALPGSVNSPGYFQGPDIEDLDCSVTWEQREYQCTRCGQAWYGEAQPAEYPEFQFAMKIGGVGSPPSPGAIDAAKESLCVIAHGGFEDGRCAQAGCRNRRLIGRFMCHLHFAFP